MAWIEHLIRGVFCLVWLFFFSCRLFVVSVKKNGASSQESVTGGKALDTVDAKRLHGLNGQLGKFTHKKSTKTD